jgi:pimeloyl-ACP methyl ester carboxylesterase
VLVGHSMGGMVALNAHRAAPERVVAMALLSTTARADTPELVRLRIDAIAEFERGRAEKVLRANAALAFHPDHATDPALLDHYVQQVLRAGAEQLIAQNRAVIARDDLRPWLAAVRCPVLVSCGDRDQLTPLERSQEIAGAIASSRLQVVPNAGHMLPWEQPERVTRMLLQWLGSLPTS